MRDGAAATDPDFDRGAPMGTSSTTPQLGPPGVPGPPGGPGTIPRAAMGGSVRERLTSLSAAEAQARLCQVLAMSGYPPTQVSQGRVDATVTIKPEPNGILLVVLIVLCLIPGIIYWYVASRPVNHQVSIFLTPTGQGTQLTVQGHPDALSLIGPVVDRLPW